jgi:hypothetical protein
MVHVCCLSSKTWETTPDGRMGWDEYFVRRDRPVYLADQVSRARSGFDASAINAVKAGSAPASQLPTVLQATNQIAWTVFRFGPEYGKAFPDGQFPVEAADELYVEKIKAAGGDAEMMYLPKLGIKGNSHMLMQDRNNLQLADMVLAWIDKHVESKGKR